MEWNGMVVDQGAEVRLYGLRDVDADIAYISFGEMDMMGGIDCFDAGIHLHSHLHLEIRNEKGDKSFVSYRLFSQPVIQFFSQVSCVSIPCM